jgi:Rrf2 family transcriptional regulator, nitric oxide-sensitive transcriptional repressor
VQLNRSTDTALRALMLVGAHRGRTTVAQLAATLDVPANHMAKVVQRLHHHGLLSTTRGRFGGVGLHPHAETVTLGWVVRLLEGDRELVDCDTMPCPVRGDCRLRAELGRARDAFLHTLDDTRLGDLIASPAGAVLVELHSATG